VPFIVRSNNQDFYLTKSFPNLLQVTSRCLLLITVFAISMVVGALYTEGDQYIYGKVYDAIGTLTLAEAFVFYTQSLSSIEIVHFIFIWSLSSYFPKVLLFSIVNTIFAGLVVRVFDLIKVNFLVTCVFLLSNFYIYVLFFAAERLKFGFLLLVLSLCIQSGKILKNSLLFISMSAHFQMILVYAPKAFEVAIASLVRLLKVQRFNLKILAVLAPLIFLPVIGDALLTKMQAYEYNGTGFDFVRISCFLMLTLWYAAKENSIKSAITMFIPLFVAVYFVSGDRVNMIAYIYFLYFALRYKNGLNTGVLITSIYFFGKTTLFLSSINQFGHGFG